MREIKFRAWDKDTGFEESEPRMLDFTELKDRYAGEMGNMFDDEDIVLQQYTGLKDRNGVEIYEGDIVLDDNRPLKDWQGLPIKENIENPDKYVVEYDNESCVFLPFGTHDMSVVSAEIIGNIYESPELLKDTA